MWITQNYTPFSVGGAVVVDRDGQKLWVVAVRGTFHVSEHGQLTRLREQPPVSRAPTFAADPASSDLLFDSDLPFTKVATDVIVRGEAWAPAGRPAVAVDVALQVGALQKRLRVHGERVWIRAPGSTALVPGRAKPFVSMPISYERAYGGVDPAGAEHCPFNPIGLGYAKNAAKLLDTLVPNVEDPRAPLQSSDQAPQTAAGLGAIAAHWRQRSGLAGTYDERWKRERAPLWPEDFDPRFFQVAPADQQVSGFLRGGEAVILQNLTPRGTLRFTLPRLRIHVQTIFTDRVEQPLDAQLHTVLFESKAQRLTLVWHTALPCHDREHLVQRSLVKWEGARTWVDLTPTSTV